MVDLAANIIVHGKVHGVYFELRHRLKLWSLA